LSQFIRTGSLSTLLQGPHCGPLQLHHRHHIHFIAIARSNFQNSFIFESEGWSNATFKCHRHILQRFGYQHLVNGVSTVPTVTPAIPAESVIVDATAGILAAPAVPASITYKNDIKNH
jgi:hypothetical protein